MISMPMGQKLSCAVCGMAADPSLKSLQDWLRGNPDLQIMGEYRQIRDFIQSMDHTGVIPQVTIVLQSYSDQYSSAEVSDLIGRLLFQRVFCCYGAWCVADGRTHEVWPVSCRMSVTDAPELIGDEIQAALSGEPALLPLAAAEEVFAHRVRLESAYRRLISRPSVLIVSDDLSLRMTLCALLQSRGHSVIHSGFTVTSAADSQLCREIVAGDFGTVLLDVDTPAESLERMRSLLRSLQQITRWFGISGFAPGSLSLPWISRIFSKSDLMFDIAETDTVHSEVVG